MRRASITLIGLLLIAGCGTSSGSAGLTTTPEVAAAPGATKAATTPAAQPAAESKHAAADIEFVRALIPHHQQGIALARELAERPATRTLAEAIIVTQQDEVVRMTTWLAAWGQAAPPSASPAPPPGDPVAALIKHQRDAIKLAQREQSGGTNPTALAFARQVIESRTGEIDQLTAS